MTSSFKRGVEDGIVVSETVLRTGLANGLEKLNQVVPNKAGIIKENIDALHYGVGFMSKTIILLFSRGGEMTLPASIDLTEDQINKIKHGL